MGMGLPSCVGMTDVATLVEAALLVKAAAQELVPVFLIVMEDNVGMTVVDINPVANVPQHKPVKMGNALELQHPIVQENNVDPTELEEAAVPVLPVNDVVLAYVSAITIAMKEIVVMQFNLTEAIHLHAPHVLVVLAPLDSPVDRTADVLLPHPAQLLLLLWIVLQKRQLEHHLLS